jgi:hypothetical protein
MNPYKHKYIQNTLDTRLVDLFVKQNPDNKWLTINDIAKWVYQTNTTGPHHRRYIGNKLTRIIGLPYTRETVDSFLEADYVQVDGYPEYGFRLKSSCVRPTAIRQMTIGEQVEKAFEESEAQRKLM